MGTYLLQYGLDSRMTSLGNFFLGDTRLVPVCVSTIIQSHGSITPANPLGEKHLLKLLKFEQKYFWGSKNWYFGPKNAFSGRGGRCSLFLTMQCFSILNDAIYSRCFGVLDDVLTSIFLTMFFKTQNIVQTILIAHPYFQGTPWTCSPRVFWTACPDMQSGGLPDCMCR